MNPEEKSLLEKTYALAKENNDMLHALRRSIRWGRIFRLAYWLLIIAGAIGTTVYIGPMLQQVYGTYQSVLEDAGGGRQSSANSPQPSPGIMDQLRQLLKETKNQ